MISQSGTVLCQEAENNVWFDILTILVWKKERLDLENNIILGKEASIIHII